MRNTDKKLHQVDSFAHDPPVFRVGVVPLPGFPLMSYACTVEPLRAANLLSRRELYSIVHFADEATSRSSGLSEVARTHAIGAIVDLDLLLVVAGGDPLGFDDPAVVSWLQKLATHVPLVGGVSGGSVILVKAGLMNGRRMTVHWEHAPELAEKYPDMIIERRLYVMDRDRITCGGGTAPIDMMHALISSHHGSGFARLVSDWFLHTDIRAATDPQRALASDRIGVASPHVVEGLTAMENHVADPLTLSQLAMMTGVSDRHLNRLFNDTFGRSAMDYYRSLRLDVGRRLVTASTMKFGDIAEATGFATASHFSNAYHKEFEVRPKQDRQGAPLVAG